METKEFLTENKEDVIKYYNQWIKDYYNATLKEFMTDLLMNFRKATIGDDLTRTDLTCNLDDAKRRLGLMNKTRVVATDYKTDSLKSKYANTAYMALV